MMTNATSVTARNNGHPQTPQRPAARRGLSRWIKIAATASGLLLLSNFAHADTQGQRGYIASIELRESAADLSLIYRGSLIVATATGGSYLQQS